MWVIVSALFLGALLGLRHAFEPDHLAAVSTFLGENPGPRRGALAGAFWGLGHSIMLLLVGGTLALAERALSPRAADGFEVLVALALVVLGTRGLCLAVRRGRQGPSMDHSHGDLTHRHQAGEPHIHLGAATFAWRPLLVGLIHGLAGSGAMTALAIAKMPNGFYRLLYVAFFGLGSIAGMVVLSAVLTWPLARVRRVRWIETGLLGATGLVALAVGVAWGAPLAQKWFLG